MSDPVIDSQRWSGEGASREVRSSPSTSDWKSTQLEVEPCGQEVTLSSEEGEKLLSMNKGQGRGGSKTLQWDITADGKMAKHDNRQDFQRLSPILKKQSRSPATKAATTNGYASPIPNESGYKTVRNRPASFSPRPEVNDGGQRKPRQTTCDFIPSRSSSRQSRFHEECTPKEDLSLVIGSRARLLSAQLRRARSDRRRRPGSIASNASLLSDREGVVHLVYTGQSELNGENAAERRYLMDRRASSVLSRATMCPEEYTSPSSDYPLIEEDDYSRIRCLLSRSSISPLSELPDDRPGFLYQMMDFDNLTENVPSFVRQHIKKNGRLTTESFILKVNYLRRRRQLGEISSTIGSSNKRAQQQIMASAPGGASGGGGSGGSSNSLMDRNQTNITPRLNEVIL